MDPITFAVVRNGLSSAAREMYWVFKRTTMLPILYEYNDFGMSIYDNELNLVAEAPGMPIFVGALDDCIARTVAEVGGADCLRHDDVLINNHPYLTAGQPADVALMAPIFLEEMLIGYAALRAHMGDLGAKGIYPTDSTDLFQEGIIFPALKLYDKGRLNEDLLKILRANSRMPVETAGNVVAGAAALRVGARAVRTLVAKYGVATYRETVHEVLDHGERMAREGLRRIPSGSYTYEDYLDDDGVRLGERVLLRVRVDVVGDQMTVDLTGSASEQAGPVNTPWGYTLTICRFALKRLVTPDIPPNGGEQRPLRVIAPVGSVFNPVAPAPCFIGWVMATRLSDAIMNALAPALPERVPAENSGDIVGVNALLRHPVTKRWVYFWESGGLGHGAMKGSDGMSALSHPICAGTEYPPTEVIEARMPIIKWRHELVTDSGGAGEYRGGLAVRGEFEVLSEGSSVACAEKTTSDVRGLQGGHSPPYRNAIIMFPDSERELVLGKKSDIPLSAGDSFVSRPSGGGGWGNPTQRDVDRVSWDVLNGYVSREQAEALYGVVITDDGKVDATATSSLRKRLSEAAASSDDSPGQDGQTRSRDHAALSVERSE